MGKILNKVIEMATETKMEVDKEVWNYVKPDSEFEIYYGEDNSNNCTVHVFCIVDEIMVVYKSRRDGSTVWNYKIDSIYFFHFANREGFLNH